MPTNPTYKKGFFTTGGGGTTLPTYETGKYLTNDGTNLSWGTNGAGDLLANGTVPLTANWDVGAFGVTALTLATSETLDAETVTDFSTWTAAAGWTFGTGKWTHGSGTTGLEDDKTSPTYDAASTYKAVVAITHAGTGGVYVGLVNKYLGYVTSSGTYTYYFRAVGDSEDALLFTPGTSWTGSVNSVSIKKVLTGNALTVGDSVVASSYIVVPHSQPAYPAISFGTADASAIGICSSPTGSMSLSASGLNLYGTTTVIDNMTAATGNEYILELRYETNKATSGNDTALKIRRTADSSSPGTSYFIDALEDAASMFSVTAGGVVTGASYVLSGTGTIASTLGNATFTTSLTAASGNEAALSLNYTTNKAAGNDTGLKINQTDTASPGTSYLLDLQVGGTSKFFIRNDGLIGFDSSFHQYLGGGSNASYLGYRANYYHEFSNTTTNSTTNPTFYFIGPGLTASSGSQAQMKLASTVNQSGTSAATDLLIDRTETAVGSGTQRLISAQVGSTERFGINNKGFEVRAYPLACTHDTATALFGITVAAGSTAGGVITYTLNVTDDDGSDDQIEVGTVQFCGLQDQDSWHTNISEVSTQAAESGTLATTWAIDVVTANTLKVTLQANSNLTTPVYTLSYTVTFNNSYVVTTY